MCPGGDLQPCWEVLATCSWRRPSGLCHSLLLSVCLIFMLLPSSFSLFLIAHSPKEARKHKGQQYWEGRTLLTLMDAQGSLWDPPPFPSRWVSRILHGVSSQGSGPVQARRPSVWDKDVPGSRARRRLLRLVNVLKTPSLTSAFEFYLPLHLRWTLRIRSAFRVTRKVRIASKVESTWLYELPDLGITHPTSVRLHGWSYWLYLLSQRLWALLSLH